jgi:hypothetical protein
MVSSTKLTNILIVLVEKGMVAMAVPVQAVVSSLEGEKHGLALPPSGLEVASPDRKVGETAPDQIAVASQDVWSALKRSMVYRIIVTGEWSNEEVPFGAIVLTRYCYVKRWRRQVWSTSISSICFYRERKCNNSRHNECKHHDMARV